MLLLGKSSATRLYLYRYCPSSDGYALRKIYVAYVETYQREQDRVLQKSEAIIGALSDICKTGPQGSREVAVMTLAAIGRYRLGKYNIETLDLIALTNRIANEDLVGCAIHELIAQWAQESTLLKSLAFTYVREQHIPGPVS